MKKGIKIDASSEVASPPVQTIQEDQDRVQSVHQIDDSATSDNRSETAPLQSVQDKCLTDYSEEDDQSATLSNSEFACSTCIINNNKKNVMTSEDYGSNKKQKLK